MASEVPRPGATGSSSPGTARKQAVLVRLWVVTALAVAAMLTGASLIATLAEGRAPSPPGSWLGRTGWLLVAVGWIGPLATLPVLLGGLVRTRRAPGRRVRPTARLLGEVGGLVVGWYVLIWLYGEGLLTRAGWPRALAAAGLTVAGSMVLMTGLRMLLEGRLRAWLRRRNLAWGAGVSVAAILTALTLLGATAVIVTVDRANRPLPPSAVNGSPAPVRRVLFWAVDGVDKNQLAYWTAWRADATLADLALTGATAYVEWASDPATWIEALTGIHPRDLLRPADRGPRSSTDGRVGLEAAVDQAFPFAIRPWREGIQTPVVWEVADWGGREVDLVGWATRPNAHPGYGRSVGPRAYRSLRALQGGDARAVRAGVGGDPELLRRLRELARTPGEDWRAGASPTEAETEAFDRAAALGVDPESLWEDRFRLRVALEFLGSGSPDILATYLDFPLDVSVAITTGDPAEVDEVNRAVYAYLDMLDGFVADLRSGLRPGDIAILLFVPAPAQFGGSAGLPGTATLLLVGEKARPETSEADVVEVADIASTLLYLQGLRISDEQSGDVVWSLLVPGLDEHMPVARIPSYARVAVPTQVSDDSVLLR